MRCSSRRAALTRCMPATSLPSRACPPPPSHLAHARHLAAVHARPPPPPPCACAQVRNLRSCIKVALDFVAPEHVGHCVRLTEELRQLPAGHHRRQDVLAVRQILLYTACACLATMDEQRKKEEAKREKQRRIDRKMTLSAGSTNSGGASDSSYPPDASQPPAPPLPAIDESSALLAHEPGAPGGPTA